MPFSFSRNKRRSSSLEEIDENKSTFESKAAGKTEFYETNRYAESQISTLDVPTTKPLPNHTISGYDEPLVTPVEYFKNLTKNPVSRTKNYALSLFPILNWGPYYPFNPSWFISDFITGVTVATVLVPQAMSYAVIATLDPVYGLYSSFIGMICYTFFGTSKDISIGPVAVMSLEVSKIIARVQSKTNNAYEGHIIATTVALICGAISLGVGLLRLGFLVELIPLPAVMAFTTGSAMNIVAGQVPGLMGYNSLVNTRAATYKVIIDTLKHLPDTTVDAAFGLVSLFILYAWKFLGNWLMKKYPNRSLAITYFLNLRNSIVIIFATLISFCIMRAAPGGLANKSKFKDYKTVGKISKGLSNTGVFKPPQGIVSAIADELPVATIVLVLEHISIAKSFGRVNDYKIDANQEFIAIGVANMVGTFFNAYPATGSFSRTALSAKCGVKTPFASAIAGCCVLIAIFCFTDAFFYIPKAALCAIIIHCVSDLVANYKSTWRLYLASPIDCLIFVVGVFIAVFATIEDGIYWAMCASAALILWRICWANGSFMGRVKTLELIDPNVDGSNVSYEQTEDVGDTETREKTFYNSGLVSVADSQLSGKNANREEYTKTLSKPILSYQYRWVPIPNKKFDLAALTSIGDSINESNVHTRYINNDVQIEAAPPGVIVYRMGESFVYPNCSLQSDRIVEYVKKTTRAHTLNRQIMWNETDKLEFKWQGVGSKGNQNKKLKFWPKKSDNEGEAAVNDLESQSTGETEPLAPCKPKLRLIHLDFSQVTGIDATSIQALIDLKRTIELHAGTDFELHFSGIINPWVIRALYNSGLSKITDKVQDHEIEVDIEESREAQQQDEEAEKEIALLDNFNKRYLSAGLGEDGALHPINGTNFYNIHFDIPSYSEFEKN